MHQEADRRDHSLRHGGDPEHRLQREPARPATQELVQGRRWDREDPKGGVLPDQRRKMLLQVTAARLLPASDDCQARHGLIIPVDVVNE